MIRSPSDPQIMKKLSFLPIFCVAALQSMAQAPSSAKHLPRIAIAGIGIESSTFSPARTDEAAFHAKYGNDIFSIYPFWAPDSSVRKAAVWVPTVDGHALPGGAVTRAAYESLVRKTLELLKKNAPYDSR